MSLMNLISYSELDEYIWGRYDEYVWRRYVQNKENLHKALFEGEIPSPSYRPSSQLKASREVLAFMTLPVTNRIFTDKNFANWFITELYFYLY